MEAPQREILTVREVALYLRLDRKTVVRLIQQGQLPGRKVGGQWRILESQLRAYLARREAHEHI